MRFIFTAFIQLLSGALLAQTTQLIHGKIITNDTNEPIPYASVSITHSTRGTAADNNGEFMIQLKPEDIGASLKISSIGFISKSIPIQNISTELVIKLESDIKMLEEVTITQQKIDPLEIIKMAIDSMGINYSQQPFNLEFYSSIDAKDLMKGDTFRLETILLGYYNGYVTSAVKKFEIVNSRATGKNPLETIDYSFWPTFEIHRADLLADPAKTGVFNKKNLDKFEFIYKGVSIYDEDTVYQIDYSAPKPTKNITGYGIIPKFYKGTVYITTTSCAVVSHSINTDQFVYSIIYRKLNQHYFPYYISGDRYTISTFTIQINNSVKLREVILDNPKVIEGRTNEFLNPSQYPTNKSFWESEYTAH